MIIEEFRKLDEPRRKAVAALTVLVAACICCYAVTRDSVVRLQAAKTNYAGVRAAYAETENLQVDLLNLQEQLREEEKQFQETRQQYFSNTEAVQFFENINAMVSACNLKPVSRVISEPQERSDGRVDDEKSEPKQQLLKTQSAEIVASGNYFDIVDFVNELTGRSQRVFITNLHVTLPAGENFNPRASFTVTLPIDLSRDTEG